MDQIVFRLRCIDVTGVSLICFHTEKKPHNLYYVK